MGSSLRQPATSKSAEAIRESLKGHAVYIEHKFDRRRAADIKPDRLRQVLSDLKDLTKALPRSERKALGRIRKIENLCYSAISIYPEPQNRHHYFQQLRSIARLLRRV